MRFSDLEHARIAILGAAREGQAVWREIRKRFPRKPVWIFAETDMESEFVQALDPAIDRCYCGPLDVSILERFDVLVRSAGISPYREELRQLRLLGRRFTTASNLWFAENPDAKTICVSGTLGKSTTTALIAHLLAQTGIRTCLAGNIGRPMLDYDSDETDWWVIELSSYQLSDLEAKPDIAVLLNLSQEHLDWHQGLEHYRADKLRLAQLATPGHLIANASDTVLVERLKSFQDVIWFNHASGWRASKDGVSRGFDPSAHTAGCMDGLTGINQDHVLAPISLPGEHNKQNLAAALTVLDALGINIPGLDEALVSFNGLSHRLQMIGERAGIRYVDDSISTTPVSVSVALQTVGHRDVVLLLGGMDRGLDWSGFAQNLLTSTPFAIVTMPDNGSKILACLKDAGVRPEGGLHDVTRLQEAVALAQELAPENGCILLSPGAPSFPHFQNFEDRGNQFKVFAGFKIQASGD